MKALIPQLLLTLVACGFFIASTEPWRDKPVKTEYEICIDEVAAQNLAIWGDDGPNFRGDASEEEWVLIARGTAARSCRS